MKAFFKAILTTFAFALIISVSAASVSAPAVAHQLDMCGSNPSGTC